MWTVWQTAGLATCILINAAAAISVIRVTRSRPRLLWHWLAASAILWVALPAFGQSLEDFNDTLAGVVLFGVPILSWLSFIVISMRGLNQSDRTLTKQQLSDRQFLIIMISFAIWGAFFLMYFVAPGSDQGIADEILSEQSPTVRGCIGSAACLFTAALLFFMKKHGLKYYGLLEVAFGVTSCFLIFIRLNIREPLALQYFIGMVGSIYICVRGLDNYSRYKEEASVRARRDNARENVVGNASIGG